MEGLLCENGEILCLFNQNYLFLYDLKTQKIAKTYKCEEYLSFYEIKSINFDSHRNIFEKYFIS